MDDEPSRTRAAARRADGSADDLAGDGGESAGRDTDRNPVAHWLFVGGDRLTMVVALSAGAALLLAAGDGLGLVGVASGSLVASVFASAITGVFTIVAVTISINQLVLSRVMGPPDFIAERTESVHAFRDRAEARIPGMAVAPVAPADFLRSVTKTLRTRAATLESTYGDDRAPAERAAVRELSTTLETVCERIESDLQESDLSLFRVLEPVLTNEFSRHLHEARRVEAEADDLTPAEQDALDDVLAALEDVNVTRHYFKTLYVHEELAAVSRLILLTGLPAVLASVGIVLLYSADAVALSGPALTLSVSAGLGVALLPMNVLFAYGLRVGTIAKMTTTFGTFVPVEEIP